MSIKKQIISKINSLVSTERVNPTINNKLSTNGSSGLLSQRYTLADKDPSEYYDGAGAGIDAPANIPVVYGEVMVSGLQTDEGEERSDLDPENIRQTMVFIVGEGPTDGIVGSKSGDDLQNTYLDCTPVVDAETGKANFGDIVVRSALAATANAVIPQLLKDSASSIIGLFDPVTGKEIEMKKKPPEMYLEELQNVAGTASKDYILSYDAETCKWVPKHINTILLAANPNSFIQKV